jgi:hypothetical protein
MFGAMNDNVQQETQRVNQDVPLATLDRFKLRHRALREESSIKIISSTNSQGISHSHQVRE